MTPERYMQIRTLADALIASCDGGSRQADEVEGLTLEECKVLDGLAFLCEECDQWYDINYQAEGTWVCNDCVGD